LQTYFRMLRMIRPYLTQVVLSVIFTILFSVLSSVSIVIIQPFLQTLFSGSETMMIAESTELSVESGDSALLLLPDSLRDKLLGIKASADSYLLAGTKIEALWRIVLVFFGLFMLKNIAHYLGSILMTYVGLRVIKDLRDDLFIKYTESPLGFFHSHRSGELISRATNDVQIANKCINVSLTNLVRDPILIFTFLFLALSINWKLTAIALTVLPLSMAVIVKIGKKLRRYSHNQQENLASLTSVLHETVYGIRVVKAFAMEEFEKKKFLAESDRLFRELFKISRMQRLSSPLSEQLSVMVGLFILWYGGSQVLTERTLPPSEFLTLLFCVFSMVHPIKELSQVNNAIQEGMAAADRIFSVLDTESEAKDEGKQELENVGGVVEFKDVEFSYIPDEPVLQGVSLKVNAGEIVALVGSSGAGKSTLVDLIPRFYDPQSGSVFIDGKDTRDIRLKSLRGVMGIVTQEVLLFNDTIRNNIAYGVTETSDEDIYAAARAANAHDFIEQLPQGYQTMIGDRGTKLSGGQRQRLSIARAILKNPPILIFDEATSALDTESEKQVQDAIDRLVQNRTTFVIAHRLSTIQNVDRIYVLQEGRIVQTGNHSELLANEGIYRDLYNLQFRG